MSKEQRSSHECHPFDFTEGERLFDRISFKCEAKLEMEGEELLQQESWGYYT